MEDVEFVSDSKKATSSRSTKSPVKTKKSKKVPSEAEASDASDRETEDNSDHESKKSSKKNDGSDREVEYKKSYHSHRQHHREEKRAKSRERADSRDRNDSRDRRYVRYSKGTKEKRDHDRDRKRERSRSEDRNRREDDSRDHRDRHGGRHNNRGRRSRSFDHVNAKWGRGDNENSKPTKKAPQDKEKPNFGLSGKLAEETNTYRGVVIKYSEPPEAMKPRRRWRLYPFKGEKALQTLYIHRQSAYLIGRERKIADLPVDHPSCSKQHAVLQYRLVPFTREDGSTGKRVRPYIIDLESANGTFINNKKIDPKKYVELLEKDVIKFGFSSREYVLLHENSKDEAMDDDVKQEEEDVKVKQES